VTISPQAGAEDLRFDGVTCRYGRGAVVRDACLRARAGEHVALIGANGSGKTTLRASTRSACGDIPDLDEPEPIDDRPQLRRPRCRGLSHPRALTWATAGPPTDSSSSSAAASPRPGRHEELPAAGDRRPTSPVSMASVLMRWRRVLFV
jgi:hypothetical protein